LPARRDASVVIAWRGGYAAALDRFYQLGTIALGLVAVRFGELRQRASAPAMSALQQSAAVLRS
jgi:hypothetical protein